MKKRLIISIIIYLFIQAFAFAADANYWQKANASTTAILKNADKLIADKKYESAFKSLTDKDDNEFLIAKKIEICLKYFVSSLEHQMFALKDLAKDEEITEVRGSQGTFSMVLYDPVKIVQSYEEAHGFSAILNMELGNYYYEILYRYPDNWILDTETVIAKANEHYAKAINSINFDSVALGNYGEVLLRQGKYDESIKLYNAAILQNDKNGTYFYNIALAYMNTGKYQLALENGQKSAVLEKDNPNYLMDAYFLLSDASIRLSKIRQGIEYLLSAEKISSEEYRVYDKLCYAYLLDDKVDLALKSADKLFSMSPENPTATQMVLKSFTKAKKYNQLAKFFEKNLLNYKDNLSALANLAFHYGQYYLKMNDKPNALLQFTNAESSFQKAGKLSDDIKGLLAQLKEQCK